MANLAERPTRPQGVPLTASDDADTTSGVSWGAVIAGGVGSASLALILLTLGVGLGLSSMSPWSNAGASAKTIGMVAIVWLIFTHIAASGMGGYLAGRLRTKWQGVHTDEVYFRDTAHGFLSWAVAALVAAALLGSVTTSILGKGIDTAGATASTAVTTAGTALVQAQGQSNVLEYFSDSLFRSAQPATDSGDASARTEAGRILATSLKRGALDSGDKAYLAKVIAARTGLAEADAQKRVDATFAGAKAEAAKAVEVAQEAADATRKAAAHSALWMFVALLAGAFSASYAATWGGSRRDYVGVTPRHPALAPQ